jgi:sphingosine kinase
VNKTLVRASQIFYSVDKSSLPHARAWVTRLLDRAYGNAQQRKRIKVLINPFSGPGNAEKFYAREAAPILAAAQCHISVEKTTHKGHAVEIGRDLDVDAWDTVACVSGDGLPHEVFNGLGQQKHSRAALAKVAVVQLPGGSGNAMCTNLFGTNSPSLAALAIVKGVRTPMDLVSVTQGPRRMLSFLSQSLGIIAECDLATDHMRWMGNARFTAGFFMRVMDKTLYPCDVAVALETDTKEAIRENFRRQIAARPSEDESRPDGLATAQIAEHEEGLPPLQYGTVEDPLPEGWTMVPNDRMGMFYAGNMAWMASDMNFFSAALPNDGCMDLVEIDGDVPVITSLRSMIAAGEGRLMDMPHIRYRKIRAYRIIPRQQGEGYISIDGERVPFEPFQAEVHKGLGTVLSKSGYLYEGSGV